MLTYKSRFSLNVFVSKKKKVGAWVATYTVFFIFLLRCFIHLFTNEAVLNIIVQATAFARVFFSTWRFKKWKSNWLPQKRVILTTLKPLHSCITNASILWIYQSMSNGYSYNNKPLIIYRVIINLLRSTIFWRPPADHPGSPVTIKFNHL